MATLQGAGWVGSGAAQPLPPAKHCSLQHVARAAQKLPNMGTHQRTLQKTYKQTHALAAADGWVVRPEDEVALLLHLPHAAGVIMAAADHPLLAQRIDTIDIRLVAKQGVHCVGRGVRGGGQGG